MRRLAGLAIDNGATAVVAVDKGVMIAVAGAASQSLMPILTCAARSTARSISPAASGPRDAKSDAAATWRRQETRREGHVAIARVPGRDPWFSRARPGCISETVSV